MTAFLVSLLTHWFSSVAKLFSLSLSVRGFSPSLLTITLSLTLIESKSKLFEVVVNVVVTSDCQDVASRGFPIVERFPEMVTFE